MTARSPLRQALETAIAAANGRKLSMKDLTVLAPQNDPFRIDTPARHRDGEWLAITARDLGLGDRQDPPSRTALHGHRPAEAGRHAVHEHRSRLALAVQRRRQGGALARLHPVRPDRRPAQRRTDSADLRVDASRSRTCSIGIDVDIPNVDDIEPAGRRRRLRRRPALQAGHDRREVVPRRCARADRRAVPRGPVPADRRDLRHADPPDGQGRRRRTADRWSCSTSPTATRPVGRCRSRSRRKLQAFKVSLFRTSSTSRCTGLRSPRTRFGSMACHQRR